LTSAERIQRIHLNDLRTCRSFAAGFLYVLTARDWARAPFHGMWCPGPTCRARPADLHTRHAVTIGSPNRSS
jgi:hypothetical protein